MKRRGATLPAWLLRSIEQAERERRANALARPMRELMGMLARGEVHEIEGRAVMRMPEIDDRFAQRAEWCEIAPAVEGWIDLWRRIAPDIRTYNLGVLAARLREDKPLTPRLVEHARAEFDLTVARILTTPDRVLTSAIRTTEIAWEFEKLGEVAA